MSNEMNTNNANTTVSTENTNKLSISIINIKHANNLNAVNAIRANIGSNIDAFNIFPYQVGANLVQFKFHKDGKRLFIEYPAFMATITPDYANIYLKKQGEPFPSICYKVKKANVEEKLSGNEILDNYINTPVADLTAFLESELTNESKAVMDNLDISVLLRILEKERNETKKEYSYAKVFDLIRSKINETKDVGYLEKLCKTCVMLRATFIDGNITTFESIPLFQKETKSATPKAPKVKQPKVTKEKENKAMEEAQKEIKHKEEVKAVIKESSQIKPFTNPIEVPVLKNINEGQEKEVTINETMVESIIDSI